METLTETKWFAKCRRGHAIRGTMDDYDGGWLDCPCGSMGMAESFHPKESTTKCGARCTGAVGPSCSCDCGGINHGAGMVFS